MLNGTVAASPGIVTKGTVLRIVLSIPDVGVPTEVSRTIIGSGFGERTDPAALVIGPTGVGLGADGTLYVADTLANRIAAIPDAATRTTSAGTGITISGDRSLNGPLGLTIVPDGDILAANANDGNVGEATQGGTQVVVKALDVADAGAGTLFGLAIRPNGRGVYFVNDGNNMLDLLH